MMQSISKVTPERAEFLARSWLKKDTRIVNVQITLAKQRVTREQTFEVWKEFVKEGEVD
jgi:hypothetical protein